MPRREKSMKTALNPQPTTANANGVGISDVFSDWVARLKQHKCKLRAGCKITVDTDTLKLNSLPTIEIKAAEYSNKYMPLKMPDGRWYFDSEEDRDAMLSRIKKSLNGKLMHGGKNKGDQ